jgi:biopolymer transport protein ExbD
MPPVRTLEGRVAARKRRSALLRLDVWVVVAALLVPLFIVIYAQWQRRRPYVAVDLATTSQAAPLPGAQRDDAMIVWVTRDGAIRFGEHYVRPDRLADEIRNAVKEGSEKRVYLEADARAKYQDVDRVLGEIRKAGVENVSFVTNATPPPETKK